MVVCDYSQFVVKVSLWCAIRLRCSYDVVTLHIQLALDKAIHIQLAQAQACINIIFTVVVGSI